MEVDAVVEQPRRAKLLTSANWDLEVRVAVCANFMVLFSATRSRSVSKFWAQQRDKRGQQRGRTHEVDLRAVHALQVEAPVDCDLGCIRAEVNSCADLFLQRDRRGGVGLIG